MSSGLEDAALEGADTSEQDGEGERLGYIVVGAGIEAFDDVGDGVAGGEHQNGDVLLHFAEAAGAPECRGAREADGKEEGGATAGRVQGKGHEDRMKEALRVALF